MGRKRKGPTARFGPRYGREVRERSLGIEREMRQPKKCPQCGALKVKRVGAGIWQCRRCSLKFTGMAYKPAYVSSKPMEVA